MSTINLMARTVLLAWVLAALAALPRHLHAVEQPNIVFILADDLGWSDLGCYGNTVQKTPRLNALARQGMRFTQAYAGAPVCGPTRACLLTGQFPARVGALNWGGCTVPGGHTTLAEALKAGGYRTGFFGKWHLGGKPRQLPQAHGFDVNVGGCDFGKPKSYFAPYRNPHMEDGPAGEYLTDRLTSDAIDFMGRSDTRPFALYLSHYAVHNPFVCKAEDAAPYKGVFGDKASGKLASYAGMVANLDKNVGRLLDALDRQGLAKNTIVVFTSDNGGYFDHCCRPLKGLKGSLYEGGIRVPLIVRWPGRVEAGVTTDAPAHSADMFPTFLEAAGLRSLPEQHRDGLSLVPLLTGKRQDLGQRTLCWHFPHGHRRGGEGANGSAIRVGDWKLIRFYGKGRERKELYNLARDVQESEELMSSEPQRAKQLEAKLDSLLAEMRKNSKDVKAK